MTNKELRAQKIDEMKKLNDAANGRAFTEEERAKFDALDAEVKELSAKIEEEERQEKLNGFSTTTPLPKTDEQGEKTSRAANFVATGKTEMRALLSTGTIAKPSNVDSNIAGLASIADGIVDDVHAIALSGTGSWVVPYKATNAIAADVTDGSAVAGTGATFNYVTITPQEWGVLDEISNQVRKMTPVAYEAAIQEAALIALREVASEKIVSAVKASTLADKKTYALDATFIRNLVLGFRSVAGRGNVKLYISQADLATLGAVRGTNEKKPVYDIEFDAGTTTSGTIKDGGTAVQFRVLDKLTAGTQLFGQPGAIDLPMWDNYVISTDQGGDYFKRNVMGIRGIQTANADLVVKGGMQIVSQPE